MTRFALSALALLVLSALTCSPAQAQEKNSVKERIRKEILEKQRLMREGRVIRTNVRVTVRLQNGSRLKGVVKGGRVIERPEGLAFVPADLAELDAGIRLWYYDGTDSYIFLPFSTIREHDIGEKLSDEEVRAIELQIASDRRAAEARRRAEVAKKAAEKKAKADAEAAEVAQAGSGATGGPGGATGEPGEKGTPGESETERGGPKPVMSEELAKLLSEFPPESGWGKEKYDDLQKRKITIGVFPNETEQRFIDNFSQWQQAYHLAKIIEADKEGQKTGQPPPAPVKK